MKHVVSLTAILAVLGMIGVAQAQDIENIDYTDRDAENEFWMCVTPNHLNDRVVNNVLDARFCVDELAGQVELLSGPEAGSHMAQSQIICMQRNLVCKAPGT